MTVMGIQSERKEIRHSVPTVLQILGPLRAVMSTMPRPVQPRKLQHLGGNRGNKKPREQHRPQDNEHQDHLKGVTQFRIAREHSDRRHALLISGEVSKKRFQIRTHDRGPHPGCELPVPLIQRRMRIKHGIVSVRVVQNVCNLPIGKARKLKEPHEFSDGSIQPTWPQAAVTCIVNQRTE